MLYLSEDEVRGLLTMETAIRAVEDAFTSLGHGAAQNIPRSRVKSRTAMLHMMSAAQDADYLGYKAYITTKEQARFHFFLYDGKTGNPLAMMEADYLGQMRTGAASGVATEYMARPEACEVGIFGSGKQARTQLRAVAKVRKLSHVSVYSPNEERRRKFAEEMAELCEVEVEPVSRPELAAEDKDIIITATTSREPVLLGQWLGEGVHINAIGANFLSKRELDSPAIRQCDIIAVDCLEQAALEMGDLVCPIEEGILHWPSIHPLSQIVIGEATGRATQEDVTLFKSAGLALEDVAVGAKVFESAVAQGVGRTLNLF